MEVFIYNELLNPDLQRSMRINWTFISYAIVEAKLYTQFRKNNKVIAVNDIGQTKSNSVIYGALYYLHDFNFYIRTLDAYHACSKSTLNTNHSFDYHHRKPVESTPIYFNSIHELATLKYREKEPIKTHAYLGNTQNPRVYKRLKSKLTPFHSYRIVDGVDTYNFLSLYREIGGE